MHFIIRSRIFLDKYATVFHGRIYRDVANFTLTAGPEKYRQTEPCVNEEWFTYSERRASLPPRAIRRCSRRGTRRRLHLIFARARSEASGRP